MEDIEKQLKKIGNIDLDTRFKTNLKKRLLNEYELLLEDSSSTNSQETRARGSYLKAFLDAFRYHTLVSVIFGLLFFSSFSAVASYYVISEDMKSDIASLIGIKKIPVEINSNQDDSKIYINGELVGEGSFSGSLRRGSFVVSVKKDGFLEFSETLKVESRSEAISIFADLIAEEDAVYADWIEYKRDDLGISFSYPVGWDIKEIRENDGNRDFTVTLSKSGNFLNFVLNPTNSLDLNKSKGVNSYRRALELREGSLVDRYLQFSTRGEFISGGVQIDGESDQKVLLKVLYNLVLKESSMESNEVLAEMDGIVQTLDMFENQITLSQDDSLDRRINEKIDLSAEEGEGNDVEDDKDGGEVEDDKPEVTPRVGSDVYQNKVYGYSIRYPKDWTVFTVRADYPDNSRSHKVTIGGEKYEFARLKVKMADAGDFILFNTLEDDVKMIESDNDFCSGDKTGNSTLLLDGAYRLVSGTGGDYTHQLCVGSNGMFENSDTGSYHAVYLNIDPEYNIDDITLDLERMIGGIL